MPVAEEDGEKVKGLRCFVVCVVSWCVCKENIQGYSMQPVICYKHLLQASATSNTPTDELVDA